MEGGKFIGGAALARKKAREVKFKRPRSSSQVTAPKKSPSLPRKISASQRFFASLLLSSKDDLISSNDCEPWNKVMGDICNRAGVPFPSALYATDDDAKTFFLMRASLVLEEARSVLVEKLCKNLKLMKQCTKCGIHVKLSFMEKKRYGFVELVFQKDSRDGCSFTTSEMYDMKPGCVVEILFHDESTGQMRNILANVTPMSNSGDQLIPLTAYGIEDAMHCFHDDMDFFLIPVTTLISEQRQFTACYERPKVKFISKLMGMKMASHIRFDDSDAESAHDDEHNSEEGFLGGKGESIVGDNNYWLDEEKKESDSDHITHDFQEEEDERILLSSINLPKLNATQEKAASNFLNGPRDNLFLVQGPPGTGKTTFMTAVLCRTFLRDYTSTKEECYVNKGKRVLVVAPTNKAISVLATRFLFAINHYIGLNVVLIGVEDALFPEEEPMDRAKKSLRSIFVYSWVEEILCDLETLKINTNAMPSIEEVGDIFTCATFLIQKLERGIPVMSEKYGCLRHGRKWIHSMERLLAVLLEENSEENILFCLQDVHECFTILYSSLKDLNSHESVVTELLNTANIIFSTLTSSGVSQMKWTHCIHELFVDEAAAATEPEIMIPLHLRPLKMLVVGDPKQLPASVTSQKAINFGLDRSLMDRLMFSCGGDHVMLDVQYRMKPDICKFPSFTFYEDKLKSAECVAMQSFGCERSGINLMPYTFIHITGKEVRTASGSYYNHDEAVAIVRLIEFLRDESKSCNILDWGSVKKIRIITFYNGQVQAIKSLLRSKGLGHVMVATVDSSQGSESDIVILSFVRSIRGERRSVGFLDDDRRINVALTRARFKLFSFGDKHTLSASGVPTLRSMIYDATKRGLVLEEKDIRI